MWKTSLGLLLLLDWTNGDTNFDCVLWTREDLPLERQPVYLVNGKLALPRLLHGKSGLAFAAGEVLTLACPGQDNRLLGGKEVEEGRCLSGSTFSVGGETRDVKELQCRSRVKATLKLTGLPCAASGPTFIQIGFQAEGWQKLFDVCHDVDRGTTLYARHTLSHLVVSGAEKNSYRPRFSNGLDVLYEGLDLNSIYKKRTQASILRVLLGHEGYFEERTMFLSRGHLAPDGDMMLSNWQHATYFFVNAAPQWLSLNSGAWLALENKLRRLAHKMGSELEVMTGTAGVLELDNRDGLPQELYLIPFSKSLPVPRYFWKSVWSPATQQQVFFIMENNPFAESAVPLCPDVCTLYGWNFKRSLTKGVIQCCPVEYANQILGYNLLHPNVTNVLPYL